LLKDYKIFFVRNEDSAGRAMTERSMSEAETYNVDSSRRSFLITGISLAAAGSVPIAAFAATEKTNAAAIAYSTEGRQNMSTITTKDGTEIFYKDWGKGQPIVFSHGWPLTADDWDAQMMFFLNHGFRVIAHDRRGHGRSSQTADGHDMDHYADDLAALTAHLDLRNAISDDTAKLAWRRPCSSARFHRSW
jgi:non-heme chloroperoxidase